MTVSLSLVLLSCMKILTTEVPPTCRWSSVNLRSDIGTNVVVVMQILAAPECSS